MTFVCIQSTSYSTAVLLVINICLSVCLILSHGVFEAVCKEDSSTRTAVTSILLYHSKSVLLGQYILIALASVFQMPQESHDTNAFEWFFTTLATQYSVLAVKHSAQELHELKRHYKIIGRDLGVIQTSVAISY